MLVLEQINLLSITIDILQFNYHDSDSKNCIALLKFILGSIPEGRIKNKSQVPRLLKSHAWDPSQA